MNELQNRRHRKLQEMLSWRLRKEATNNQAVEAEALAWAIDTIDNCFGSTTSDEGRNDGITTTNV